MPAKKSSHLAAESPFHKVFSLLLVGILIHIAPMTLARATGSTNKTKVGRKAAAKYMAVDKTALEASSASSTDKAEPADAARSPSSAAGDPHYLALHLGSYVSDEVHKWGDSDKLVNIGRWNTGVTYRMGEWRHSMDLAVRIDLASYGLPEGFANKLSFLPVLMFPDATSRFPLYFGAGLGLGIFVSQTPNESPFSLDYQVFAGARFFEVLGSTGFFIEAGLKNHFHLFSDGQFNGTFVVLGSVFSF